MPTQIVLFLIVKEHSANVVFRIAKNVICARDASYSQRVGQDLLWINPLGLITGEVNRCLRGLFQVPLKRDANTTLTQNFVKLF